MCLISHTHHQKHGGDPFENLTATMPATVSFPRNAPTRRSTTEREGRGRGRGRGGEGDVCGADGETVRDPGRNTGVWEPGRNTKEPTEGGIHSNCGRQTRDTTGVLGTGLGGREVVLCTSTRDASSGGDPGEDLGDTDLDSDSAHYPPHTEAYSSMVLWEPSRGLLMEKVIGRYRFIGGVNEPFLFEGRSGNLECDTRPTERATGAIEITAGREIGPVCMLDCYAIRHYAVKSWRGGDGRSGYAFRSREGTLAWVKPDWMEGGDVGIDDL